MHNTRKIPLVQLNDFLTCKLCKGYYIDATTIIECLHTFCRSCIVRYLAKNKYCPVCDVQVHKSKPLLNIRPDKIIQDIVYKLVPRLFQNEMCKRREFYSKHPNLRPSNLEQCGEASSQHILTIDETICLTLNYAGSIGPSRYLRCPAGLGITHLQKLLRSKFGLPEHYKVDIFHNQDCLNPHLTLLDIAYTYLWRRKGPLELTFQIYENSATNLAVGVSPASNLPQSSNNNVITDTNTTTDWKEIQLQISESGEMCFTNVDSTAVLNQEVTKLYKESSEQSPGTKSDQLSNTNQTDNSKNSILNNQSQKKETAGEENYTKTECIKENSGSTISTNSDCDNKPSVIENSIDTSNVTNAIRTPSPPSEKTVVTKRKELFNGKHKSERNPEDEPAAKQPKQTILNHTLNLGINHLSNNHPLKRNSHIRKSIENASSDIESLSAIAKSPTSVNLTNSTQSSSIQPTIINKECNIASGSSNSSTPWIQTTPTTKLPCYTPKNSAPQNTIINIPKYNENILKSKVPITILNNKLTTKSKPSNAIGYKTLREPPKTWNPQLPRSLLLKGADQKESDGKNAKPAKFFKMRNNMPRYLGNPASGVKPLYQVHTSPEKDKEGANTKGDKSEIKKHSIVKIDPKTLKPIIEKAPESTSLSGQSELKINTSSVPIFNPLKLQNSPRSPKSPQSPKMKTSPSSKREKLSLNYIPPNPFIPNLSSPTLSPNQFLYPPGFPTYDHRLVAAYHNLLFGQRFVFPGSHHIPRLNYDLTQRKTFDTPTCTSPVSPIPSMPVSSREKESKKEGGEKNVPENVQDANSQDIKVKKKPNKDSAKNEKSLENAVEKLTQNRVNKLKTVCVSDNNGITKESSDSGSPKLPAEEKSNINCKTSSIEKPLSNNCVATEDEMKCSNSKSELKTQSEVQSMQNGDKVVSNNNTIESVSLENILNN